ncbi:MAG: hypothetical protein EBU07_18955, partial [Betaproteobacteria bacterium]|nr:hypothetical protein [Betaproteobacteria bacterium]
RRADGRYAWLHSRGQAVWDNSGRAMRMAGSTEDVTVRKTMEFALEESRAALRNLAEELSRAVEAELTKAGLQLNAGHALDRRNAGPVAAIAGVRELHIGHSIVSRALAVGMCDAVREMKAVLYAAAGGEA